MKDANSVRIIIIYLLFALNIIIMIINYNILFEINESIKIQQEDILNRQQVVLDIYKSNQDNRYRLELCIKAKYNQDDFPKIIRESCKKEFPELGIEEIEE